MKLADEYEFSGLLINILLAEGSKLHVSLITLEPLLQSFGFES